MTGFVVSKPVCDVIAIGAATAQAIHYVIEYKTEINKNIKTFYFAIYYFSEYILKIKKKTVGVDRTG